MPPEEEVSWWRGKHGFQVGFFPSECVELFPDRLAPGLKADPDGPGASVPGVLVPQGPLSPTSVCKKHGKLLGFLRTFMKSRPSKQRLKQRGILRERVFGCDLGEHLLNSGHDVPQVLRCCSEFIEKHGLVDGIYRLSGVASNIQKLRHEFDSERVPELSRATYLQDIHCVSSLCKLYFRELPNPLLTYQLYPKFAEAVAVPGEEERLVRVHDVIQQLPPPHYRTLEFLLRHLARVATHSVDTSMHVKNLAIVWAPNLLRSLELEAVGLSGAEAFQEVRVQAVVVEFLLRHVQVLFSDKFTSIGKDGAGRSCLPRPKSLLGSCPSTRLLSLEEAQARTQAQQGAPCQPKSPEAEPGRGPPGRRPPTLDSPQDRRRTRGGSWKTFFALGGHKRAQRLGGLLARGEQTGLRADTITLRSAKSEESLTSQSSTAGLHKLHRLRRPRSSSDAFPALPGAPRSSPPASLKPCRSCESLSSSGGCSESLEGLPASVAQQRGSLWLDEDDELDSDPELSPHGFLDLLPLRRSPLCCPSLSDASDSAPSPARLPFARKVAQALSPRGPPLEHPAPALEISEPTAVSLPAKVLEMLGAGEAGGVLSPGRHRSPPHMLSRLLQDGDGQLSRSCQREVLHKLSQAESGSGTQSPKAEAAPPLPGALPLFRHGPPPPPPKDPARLMALALAESAHQAARRQQRAQLRRSLSLEGGGEGALYSVVRPSPPAPPPGPSLQRQQSEGGPRGQRRERAGGPQVPWVRAPAPAPAPGGEGGRAGSAAPPYYSQALPDSHRWASPPPTSPQALRFPRASAPFHPPAPPKPPAPLHFHSRPTACLSAAPPWPGPPCATPPYPPEPQLHPRHRFPAPRHPGGPPAPRRPLLELPPENLYYEIVSELPVYQPRPPRPPAPPEYLAALNASYGVFQRPRPGPAPPLRAAYNPPEPVYVNLPHHSRASPPSASSSASASPPPEAGHQRSRSDPGAVRAALHCAPGPALPQKQRQGPRAAPGWAYGPGPGLYPPLVDMLPCGGTVLRFCRPSPPGWEPATGCAPHFAAYTAPRPPALLSPSLMDGYRLGPYPPYAERPPPHYSNVARKEGPPAAPACLAPTWTLHSEGQTRSYC